MGIKSKSLLFFLCCCHLLCVAQQSESQQKIYPNIWGEKQIFAFSALDGTTNFDEPFTCLTLKDQFGIRISNNEPLFSSLTQEEILKGCPLWFGLKIGNQYFENITQPSNDGYLKSSFKIISASLIEVELSAKNSSIRIVLSFTDKSTIMGRINAVNLEDEAVEVYLNFQSNQVSTTTPKSISFKRNFKNENNTAQLEVSNNSLILSDKGIQIPLTNKQNIDFTLSLLYNNNVAKSFDEKIYQQTYLSQLQFFDTIKTNHINDNTIKLTYLKAVSVLKANTESATGKIKFQWTTPDRTPHRRMWLWDAAFHGMGLKYINTKWAEDNVKAVLGYVAEDGFIPHMMDPRQGSKITQPPVLAWAVWDVYTKSGNKEFLLYSFTPLKKFLQWLTVNRDKNNNGLLEWTSGDESGMDNSPRFDKGPGFDAVDFNCFLVNDYYYMTQIAGELGFENEVSYFKKLREKGVKNINAVLWNKDKKMYCDKYIDGTFSEVSAISDFLPLFASVASKKQAKSLVQKFTDTASWWTTIPGPSISKEHPSFGTNMWRGPVWINYSYFHSLGLKNYGFKSKSLELVDATLKLLQEWYHKEGTLYEFYDPLNITSPKLLPRKGSKSAIHDYGWSCSLFVELVEQQVTLRN